MLRMILAMMIVLTTLTVAEASENLRYTVMRDGDEIGTHSFSFSSSADGNKLQVDIQTDINVRVFGISFYRFLHNGREVWNDGELISYESKTDDDGTEKYMMTTVAGNGLAITGSAGERQSSADIFPASLWNKRIIEQNVLLNTLDGSLMTVMVKDLGEETINQEVVHHYAVTGDLERELWYDPSGKLRKVRFSSDDGSTIEYNPIDK